jgi:hypothetical protein
MSYATVNLVCLSIFQTLLCSVNLQYALLYDAFFSVEYLQRLV